MTARESPADRIRRYVVDNYTDRNVAPIGNVAIGVGELLPTYAGGAELSHMERVRALELLATVLGFSVRFLRSWDGRRVRCLILSESILATDIREGRTGWSEESAAA